MTSVFVGFFYDDEKAAELLQITKRGLSAAANQYQKGFLSGLPGKTQIISTLSMGMFPRRCKRLLFKREERHWKEKRITYLPFVNFYFIKDMIFRAGLRRELERVIRSQEYTKIYIYSLNVVFEKVMAVLKRKYGQRVDYCLIIPDLPGESTYCSAA